MFFLCCSGQVGKTLLNATFKELFTNATVRYTGNKNPGNAGITTEDSPSASNSYINTFNTLGLVLRITTIDFSRLLMNLYAPRFPIPESNDFIVFMCNVS